jgi:hypothetical protein
MLRRRSPGLLFTFFCHNYKCVAYTIRKDRNSIYINRVCQNKTQSVFFICTHTLHVT